MTTLKGNTTVSHRSEKTLHDLAQKTDQQTLPRVSLAEFQAARICLSWICKAISWKYYAGDPSPKNIQKSFHIFPHHPSIPRYSKYSTPSLPPSFRVTAPRAPDICTATTHLGHAATRSTAQHRAATRSTSRFIEVHRGSSRFIGLQPRCGGKVSPSDCRAKVAPSSAKTSRNCPTYLRQKDEK